jgi:hypothetical protein
MEVASAFTARPDMAASSELSTRDGGCRRVYATPRVRLRTWAMAAAECRS